MTSSPANPLDALLTLYARRAEEAIRRYLVEPGAPQTLADALTYCIQGGKRLRPALVYLAFETARDCSRQREASPPQPPSDLPDRAAAAVEMVHVYSLVHDDLPAMDDDALRRGRPTAHVQFGEAMAILAGDALLTRAFACIAESDDAHAVDVVAELAHGAGQAGMVAGQVADMGFCDMPDGEAGLRYIHARKTGALLRAAVRMGARAGHADSDTLDALTVFAEALGLAFQVLDDLLDATATAEQLGKTPGQGRRCRQEDLRHSPRARRRPRPRRRTDGQRPVRPRHARRAGWNAPPPHPTPRRTDPLSHSLDRRPNPLERRAIASYSDHEGHEMGLLE